MKFLIPIVLIGLVSCQQKKTAENVANSATPTTTNTTTAAAPTAAAATPKKMNDYLTLYKKVHDCQKDSFVVHQENKDFIFFSHFPKDGEIIGTIYAQLRILRTEGKPDRFLYYFHSSVEGFANLDPENLMMLDENLKAIKDPALPVADIKKAFDAEVKKLAKNKATKKYNAFFVQLDADVPKFSWGFINDQDDNMLMGKILDAEFRTAKEYYWNAEKQVFTTEYPYAG